MLGRRRFLQHAASSLLMMNAANARAQSARLQVFSDPAMLRHEPPPDHPETPKRLDAVMATVRRLERDGQLSLVTPRPATDDDLLLVHTPEYVKKVRAEIASGRRMLSTGDTDLSSGSLTAALAAAGTVVSAVDAVMAGRTRTAFCAVRPPGHHASQSRGMGFCLFNNLGIGPRCAQRRPGVRRI